MPTCPGCRGERKVFVFADGHHEDGAAFSRNGLMPCLTCKGVGSITGEHAERIAVGKMMRDARVAKRVSLLEASRELGCSPAELSAVERGDLPKSTTT